MTAHVAALIVVPVVLWKALFSDRQYLTFLGLFRGGSHTAESGRSIWIHASSVGEVKASMLLIEKIRGREPDARIVLTLFTPRGMKVAKEELSTDIECYYLPLDIPVTVRRAFRKFNPGILVITEAELWPNFLRRAFNLMLPVAIVNGRLSDSGIRRYQALRTLFGPILRQIDYIHTQSESDALRFLKLGAREKAVCSGNNIKIAGMLSNLRRFDRQSLLEELKLPDDVRIIVCGSTREGEERIILDAFKEARSKHTDLRLLLAPRHTARIGEVEKTVSEYNYASVKRSTMNSIAASNWDVMILDTMGELWKMYGIGVCAFVGGSLVPIGGHNPLEPIALGVPTCFGPHMENARQLADKCVSERIASIVQDSNSLAEFIDRSISGRVEVPSISKVESLFASDIDAVTDRVLSLWSRGNA
jgi:3-deoxy-D-manno-octulosonic-acid transferase